MAQAARKAITKARRRTSKRKAPVDAALIALDAQFIRAAAALDASREFWNGFSSLSVEQAAKLKRVRPHPDQAARPVDEICDKIFAIKPRTIEGLVARARIARFVNGDLWEENRFDLDWDKRVFVEAIDGIFALADK